MNIMKYTEYLKTDHWKELRAVKLHEANDQCETCKSKSRLQVHHLTYERVGNELLTDLKVLCESCHEKVHNIFPSKRKKRKARPKLKTKAEIFLRFVEKSCARFDGSTAYSFGNVEYTVGAMKGFIAFKPEVANKFINFAMDKMKEAKNLSGETRRRLIALKCRDTFTK